MSRTCASDRSVRASVPWRAFAVMMLLSGLAPSLRAAEFDCLLEPRQVIAINGPVEALIADVKVERGDRVARGDVLVEFDSGMERASVELARYRAEMLGTIEARQVRHEHARLRHARRDELTQKEFVSRQEFEDSEAEMRLSEAELREAMDNQKLARLEYLRAVDALRLRSLLSPIDGVVTERLMNPGEVSEFGKSPILRLAEIGVLNVEVILPAAVYRLVAPGDEGVVRPEAPIGGEYSAAVTIVDHVIDAASGTFGVRLQLPNADHAIPAGFRCRVEFPKIP
jgi:RND family efflux transporter MFP subunit